MNFEYLKKSINTHVQLVPPACFVNSKNHELRSDDDWIIEVVAENEVTITNSVTKHSILLGKDHIHHFTTNPQRDSAGIKYGFLTLNVQVFVKGKKTWVRPNTRPGEAVKLAESHTDIPPLPTEEVLKRIQRAREDLGLAGTPTFSLVAWPEMPTDFSSLFESRDNPLVQILEHPPELRPHNFGVFAGSQSAAIEGKLRRCSAHGYRSLEIWRDGVLISVTGGDGNHLCWGIEPDKNAGLKINNLVLTETVYMFCEWALSVYNLAARRPTLLIFRMILSDMAQNGKPFNLNPHPHGSHGFMFYDNSRPAPISWGTNVETQAEFADAEAGLISYELLSDFYAWFGFDLNQMPYVNSEAQPKIDPMMIVASAAKRPI